MPYQDLAVGHTDFALTEMFCKLKNRLRKVRMLKESQTSVLSFACQAAALASTVSTPKSKRERGAMTLGANTIELCA